ncbi:class V lanthionine synthetase subunit LxmK (plasmid) [Arthrobacter sp. Z1-15]
MTPRELSDAPAVNSLLERVGLGSFSAVHTSFPGRNHNWSGVTTTGAHVFVKHITGEDDVDTGHRMERTLALESAIKAGGGEGLLVPKCLGWSVPDRMTVFEYIPDSRTAAEMVDDGEFTVEHARKAGTAVATLHSLKTEDITIDESPAPMPPLPWLTALPWLSLSSFSIAQLQAWRLIQEDEELVSALQELRRNEAHAPQTAIHADLRLDQFIVSDGNLYLNDWEEFRLGDPARDVGGWIGEWLFHSAYTMAEGIESRDDLSQSSVTHEQLVENGVKLLRKNMPMMSAFWAAYCEERDPDPELAQRAAAFAGWHLLDRLLASAAERAELTAPARAAAGVGRSVLIGYKNVTSLLGMGASKAEMSTHEH